MAILDQPAPPVSPLAILWARIKAAVLGDVRAWRWAWGRRSLAAAQGLKAAGVSAKGLAPVFETPEGSLDEALNHTRMVQVLRQAGVDPRNCVEVLTHPPALQQAAEVLDLPVMAALIAAGADVNERHGSEQQKTALDVVLKFRVPMEQPAASVEKQLRALDMLCAAGALTNAQGYNHRAPLLSAPWGRLSEALLNHGANPCAQSHFGGLVFHDHLLNDNSEIFTAPPAEFAHMLRLHLQHGAHIEMEDGGGYSLLGRLILRVAVRGHGATPEEIANVRSILTLLVEEFGADRDAPMTAQKNTLLHVAIATGPGPPPWLLAWLLDRPALQLHALLTHRNEEGETALAALQASLQNPEHQGKEDPLLAQAVSRVQSCTLELAVGPVQETAPRLRARL